MSQDPTIRTTDQDPGARAGWRDGFSAGLSWWRARLVPGRVRRGALSQPAGGPLDAGAPGPADDARVVSVAIVDGVGGGNEQLAAELAVPESSTPPQRPRRVTLLQKRRIATGRAGGAARKDAAEQAMPDRGIATRSRSLSGTGFIAPGVSRNERRRLQRAARGREHARRKVVMEDRRAALLAERQARKDAAFLPANGERGQMAGRPLYKLKMAPHRATTDTLAIAYPFLAEAGLGSQGALIGHDS